MARVSERPPLLAVWFGAHRARFIAYGFGALFTVLCGAAIVGLASSATDWLAAGVGVLGGALLVGALVRAGMFRPAADGRELRRGVFAGALGASIGLVVVAWPPAYFAVLGSAPVVVSVGIVNAWRRQ
jgi:hypothetical protein